MKQLIIVSLLFALNLSFAQSINIYCSETTLNYETFELGKEYKERLERVFSNIENAPIVVERDNLSNIFEFIKNEENLHKDIGSDNTEKLMASNVDYLVNSNFESDPLKSDVYFLIDCMKIRGNQVFTKFSFPTITLSQADIDNPIVFEQKLKDILCQFSFVKGLGVIENEILSEINQRIENSLNEVIELREDLVAITDYYDMAEMNIIGQGKYTSSNKFISISSNLMRLMSKAVEKNENIYEIIHGDESEKIINEVINSYPRFPFGYYVKSIQLKKRNDPNWKTYATKAIEILEYTTKIKSCNHNHFQVLDNLRLSMNKF